MDQTLFNVALSIISAIISWVLKTIWASHKELQDADAKLAEKVNKIELMVAGDYVKRDDFERMATAIFAKLDKISDKIDAKADK